MRGLIAALACALTFAGCSGPVLQPDSNADAMATCDLDALPSPMSPGRTDGDPEGQGPALQFTTFRVGQSWTYQRADQPAGGGVLVSNLTVTVAELVRGNHTLDVRLENRNEPMPQADSTIAAAETWTDWLRLRDDCTMLHSNGLPVPQPDELCHRIAFPLKVGSTWTSDCAAGRGPGTTQSTGEAYDGTLWLDRLGPEMYSSGLRVVHVSTPGFGGELNATSVAYFEPDACGMPSLSETHYGSELGHRLVTTTIRTASC